MLDVDSFQPSNNPSVLIPSDSGFKLNEGVQRPPVKAASDGSSSGDSFVSIDSHDLGEQIARFGMNKNNSHIETTKKDKSLYPQAREGSPRFSDPFENNRLGPMTAGDYDQSVVIEQTPDLMNFDEKPNVMNFDKMEMDFNNMDDMV